MGDDDRDDRSSPADEGFIASLLRESTITGAGDDADQPPEEPQGTNPATTDKQPDGNAGSS